MPSRTIHDEDHFRGSPLDVEPLIRRRAIMRSSAAHLARDGVLEGLHRQAAANVERWRQSARGSVEGSQPTVIAGDWGEVTGRLTRDHGRVFAVLNMANAQVAGGGYVEGYPAQEENIFRRSDCHLALDRDPLVGPNGFYTAQGTRLVEGRDGRVHLDAQTARVCFRGPEDPSRSDLGYEVLDDEAVFPFFEVRTAAQDLRGGAPFDESHARQRIDALLDTLIGAELRHVVLGALGCGAFENPSEVVARLFRTALLEREGAFDVVAFAIRHAGYGPGNHPIFARVFA